MESLHQRLKFKILTFLIIISYNLCGIAQNLDKCISYYVQDVFSTYSKEDFSRPYRNWVDNTKYSLSGLKIEEVKDQCKYGSCWAQSSASILEHRARKRGIGVSISTDYLIAIQLLDSAWHALNFEGKIDEFPSIMQSYDPSKVPELIKKYGLIPKNIWESRISFIKDEAVANRLVLHLNSLVWQLRKTHLQKQITQSNSYPSNEEKELLKKKSNLEKALAKESKLHNYLSFFRIGSSIQNKLAKLKLELQIVNEKLNLLKQENIDMEKNGAWKEVLSFLRSYLGPIPEMFEFDGQNFDRKSFGQHKMFAPLIDDKLVDFQVTNLNSTLAFIAISEQLKDVGEPVQISLKWTKTFVDHQNGILSLEAFNPFNQPLQEIVKMSDKTTDKDVGYHAMDVVDFAYDEKGTPAKLLTLNSHGLQVGDEGYYHLYASYFFYRATQIRIYSRYLDRANQILQKNYQ